VQKTDILKKMDELCGLFEPGCNLPVNEALISYRLADVCGLLVNQKSVKSLARAAGFLKVNDCC
jgi:hypothetical protein